MSLVCHRDDSWFAKQIHIFRVAVGLSWITVGDGGARIGPKTLPRSKALGGVQIRSFTKEACFTTKPINPLDVCILNILCV